MEQYDHKKIESKWQKQWEEENIYEPDMKAPSNPFYNLMMFPYPSADGMHMGNMRTFAGIDAYGRFQRMQGNDVFQPIGLDGFGIHAENYAIKIGKHPTEQATVTQERFYNQFKLIGNGFPWNYSLETYDPDYYRWTQWLFLQMYKHDLVERKKAMVNWCPGCKTVLADEQVIKKKVASSNEKLENSKLSDTNVCERCDTETTKKETEQWFFKITEYADRLLENIDEIDWPEKIKTTQRNWIGRSEGAEIKFKVKEERGKMEGRSQKAENEIEIFTTRIDTIFGATFIVLAPEHPLIENEKLEMRNEKKVREYVEGARKKTELERKIQEKEKTGVFTGEYAVHPLTGEEIPIWVADFVLMDYGTGAIMGVPAHDERDYEFAKKFGLPIRQVIVQDRPEVFSYLMGADNITTDELEKIGITIVETIESGSRKLIIPRDVLPQYESLIIEKMTPGYWNEYIGEETVFVFKNKQGEIERLVLTPDTEDKIHQLSEDFIEKGWTQHVSVWGWLADNEFYRDYILHPEFGRLIHSGPYTGLTSEEAIEKIVTDLGEAAEIKTNYHLRDWLISRQRYWGPPIPMVHCDECGWQPVSEDDLPIKLPYVEDYKPTGDGKAPLEKAPEEWLFTDCSNCGKQAKRETDVSDTFLDSAWYFLAYPNLPTNEWKNGPIPFNQDRTNTWLPVNAYIGGAEHAVLHLLYARFVSLALHDWGMLNFSESGEPFPYLVANGLLLRDGGKMSKSKGNVIVPDDYIEQFGADAVRLYLAFTGPFESDGDFRDAGMESMAKFVERVWDMYARQEKFGDESTPGVLKELHRAIKKVADDINRFKYNTAVSTYMEVMNAWKEEGESLTKEDALTFIQIMAPFAPFMSEEIWREFGQKGSIHHSRWPEFDEELTKSGQQTIVVQVNGKLRGTLKLDRKAQPWEQQEVEELALALNAVQRYVTNKTKFDAVYVPDRLINFVVKEG